MIRRDVRLPDGDAAWMLISQVAHARLAEEVARAWDHSRRPLIEPREAFLQTVRRHDDGWLAWEQRPETHRGTPRDFMEMPVDESLAIWRRSIAVAATIGPAAAVIVGGHFRELLQRGLDKHEAERDWPPDVEHLAEEFVAEQDDRRAEYLAACDAAGRRNAEQFAGRQAAEASLDRGLAWLQMFDFLSLWLCCGERTEPQAMPGGDGETYVFTPADSGAIVVNPWPLSVPKLDLGVVGRRVAAVDYPTAEALAAAPSVEIELRWTLRPA